MRDVAHMDTPTAVKNEATKREAKPVLNLFAKMLETE
jgi:hypothetical protein